MSVIITHTDNDISTDEVMAWLYNKDSAPKRIKGDDFRTKPFSIRLKPGNKEIKTSLDGTLKKNNETNPNNAFWFRRWFDFNWNITDFSNDQLDKNEKVKLAVITHHHLRQERLILDNWLHSHLSCNDRSLNKGFIEVNKLQVLDIADQVNLCIPDTLITNSREEVKEFLINKDRIITKPISEAFLYIDDKNGSYVSYTEEVTAKEIDQMPTKIGTSLFQELLHKQFELRVFYLDGSFYPMTIFSQRNSQTQIDFRRYDRVKPNRNTSFKLPTDIEKKLQCLLEQLKLKTASVDMVYTKDNRYVFLEVNPVGQFGMVSKPCNYYLEEKIADYILSMEQKA
ncbi:grasp-with-spasm system ATP-grasp peptide maturase [Zooshikella marina]|uniref:grasp-with-spasm system ATP-grasp peptide maturase n=1 Tax=Zooshikella ganghwensis TaxID=202772 RepID=UPI001BAF7E34|nr:grasp-with-spasm system ATP-grasp peptide maturase [Zooshikella ganghwensis]MBU2706448.1 grasp-with-spasm system ATP-grasp peptide maturase [Zooshikella ganghwensis]